MKSAAPRRGQLPAGRRGTRGEIGLVASGIRSKVTSCSSQATASLHDVKDTADVAGALAFRGQSSTVKLTLMSGFSALYPHANRDSTSGTS
jgi:hypothetical protein